MDIEQIAKSLGGARRTGNDWSCRCPAHEDRKASLSIGQSADGKVLVHCHAGCEQDLVVGSLKNLGLWPSSSAKPDPVSLPPVKIALGSGRGQIVATYDYTDEHGELLYQAVRYEPKDFRQRKPEPNGGWNWSIKGVRRVLYRLPEVMQAVAQGQVVYVCEGEKDVEAARAIGLVATCNAMGADNGTGNKWFPEFADALINADVVVVPDQDEPGQRHAAWVIQTLIGKARNVGRLDVPVGKDLADWINAGATVGDIEGAIVDAVEVEVPPPKDELFVSVGDLVANLQPIRWLVEDYIEQDSLALVFGAPGGGKSFVTVDIACCVATGTAWHGHPVDQGAVFYIAGEGHNGLARRFAAWQSNSGVSLKDAKLYKSKRAISMFNEASAKALHEEVLALSEATGAAPKLIILDTVARNFGDGDENSTSDMGKFVEHIDTFIRVPFGCNVLLVHHSGHNMDRARGSSALKAALDAEYAVVNEGGTISLTATKMKDAEFPAELNFRFKHVDLGVLDGMEISSVVLEAQDNVLDFKVGTDSAGEDVMAKTIVTTIERRWESFDTLKDAWNTTKAGAQRMVKRCVEKGLLEKDGSGYKLTEKASSALSLTGRNLTQQDKPIWKRGE
jgi:hypothetical protein